ncbi:hypothetical protein ACHAXM_010486 [Skeletonema potamos]
MVATAESNQQRRLDAAWEAATEECNKDNNNTNNMSSSNKSFPPSLDDNNDDGDGRCSPPSQFNGSNYNNIETYDEDPFLLPSNETSPTSLASYSSSSSSQLQQLQLQQVTSSPTLAQRYRTFLQKHESLLSLIEIIMERFVFYGHLFKSHNFEGEEEVRTEMYYATWNVIRWINDVVLVGVGCGMGLTVGTREEWLLSLQQHQHHHQSVLSKSNDNNKLQQHQWKPTSKLDMMIPIIRATLTATTCIYPAVEAFSRRSSNKSINNNHRIGNDGEILSRRYHRAALVSYRLEKVRFMGRLALLVIGWWAKLQRKRQQQQQQRHLNDKVENYTVVPSLLQRGGELDPYEIMVPLKDAEDEARIVQYVGRRTGRRSVSNAGTTIIGSSSTSSSSSHLYCKQGLSAALTNVPFITEAINLIEWTTNVLSSYGGNKLGYVYAVGEILHILRPLYWSRAECGEWQRKRLLAQQQQQQQQQLRGGISNSWTIWKAWWVSLLMDLISDKLLRLSSGGGIDAANMGDGRGGRRGSSFMGRRGGKRFDQTYQSYSSSTSPSAEEAKLAELEWRRSRHGLYLLRSPMYDVVTRPVASFIARVVSMIPSMGLGRWAAEYVLDMMSYWNSNHFMLES